MIDEITYTKQQGTQKIKMNDNSDEEYEKDVNTLYFGFNNDDVWMSHFKKENSWTTNFWNQKDGVVLKKSNIITRSSIEKIEDKTKKRLVKHLVDFGVAEKPRFGLKLLDRIINELTAEDKAYLYLDAYSDLKILDKKTELFFFKKNGRKGFNAEAVANNIITVQRDQRGSNVLAMEDTKNELFLYDIGVYHEGIHDIEIQIRELLGAYSTINYVSESLKAIRMKCLVPRKIFNKENADLNLMNGIFNYETQEFRPHSINDLFTTAFNLDYDPHAECPNIMKFLEWAHPNEKNKFTIMEEIAYMFVNGHKIQRLFMWQGTGSNGKSTIMNVITAMLGKENISYATLQDLEGDKNYCQQGLYGKKLNMSGDIPKTETSFDIINKLTGGDPILVRRIYKDGFTLVNQAKLLFSMNDIPNISNASDGPLRRLIPTYWYSTKGVDGEAFSKEFMDSLLRPEEISGFFNMLMKLIPPLLERGDMKYGPTTDETHNILESMKGTDIEEFIHSKCERFEGEMISVKALYKIYMEWSKMEGSLTKPIKMFEQTIKNMSFKIAEKTEIKFFAGLRFKS